jgi:hypothetical protein
MVIADTENTRAAYPLDFIPNFVTEGRAGHAETIVFLTADAFGVLPPISLLSPEQAMYYFLSGYTAKVAGTERGVTEPQATFSACFGAVFLVWPAAAPSLSNVRESVPPWPSIRTGEVIPSRPEVASAGPVPRPACGAAPDARTA